MKEIPTSTIRAWAASWDDQGHPPANGEFLRAIADQMDFMRARLHALSVVDSAVNPYKTEVINGG